LPISSFSLLCFSFSFSFSSSLNCVTTSSRIFERSEIYSFNFSSMSSKSTKEKASRSSSRRKVSSIPKEKPLVASRPAQSYLVVDTTLPSHIIPDRSLFTTYTAGRQVYRTAFGHDIIMEGIGDVHIQVFAAGQYICFCMRNCWHVPSSAHHFLSCATVTSLGHQVMIAGHSPRMIYSHNRRLVEPNLPKYCTISTICSRPVTRDARCSLAVVFTAGV
jgi:hypothetical protein